MGVGEVYVCVCVCVYMCVCVWGGGEFTVFCTSSAATYLVDILRVLRGSKTFYSCSEDFKTLRKCKVKIFLDFIF